MSNGYKNMAKKTTSPHYLKPWSTFELEISVCPYERLTLGNYKSKGVEIYLTDSVTAE